MAEHHARPRIARQVFRNYYRVANVWLDEYTPRVAQKHTPMLAPGFGSDIDLSARQALRKELQCKSMDW
jgi:hypothetical protein